MTDTAARFPLPVIRLNLALALVPIGSDAERDPPRGERRYPCRDAGAMENREPIIGQRRGRVPVSHSELSVLL
jgi:hypothetical protein